VIQEEETAGSGATREIEEERERAMLRKRVVSRRYQIQRNQQQDEGLRLQATTEPLLSQPIVAR